MPGAHTVSTPINRYYNPPADIPNVGRRLNPGTFYYLRSQLGETEILFGL